MHIHEMQLEIGIYGLMLGCVGAKRAERSM